MKNKHLLRELLQNRKAHIEKPLKLLDQKEWKKELLCFKGLAVKFLLSIVCNSVALVLSINFLT